jgi:hypothetical protein
MGGGFPGLAEKMQNDGGDASLYASCVNGLVGVNRIDFIMILQLCTKIQQSKSLKGLNLSAHVNN